MSLGIALAIVAMLVWGCGDFFIQKSTRNVGDWETLCFISLVGAVGILPFIVHDIPSLLHADRDLFLMVLASFVFFTGTLLGFEALKEGKIAVIEPLYALEIPVAGILAFVLLGEALTWLEVALILLLTIGLGLVSVRPHHVKEAWLEKGTLIAALGSTIMGLSCFLVGLAARLASPLLITWFLSVFMLIASGIHLGQKGRIGSFIRDLRAGGVSLWISGATENIAWIAFAFALGLAPMAIVTALVEISIAVNVLLGIIVNREKLVPYQYAGLVLSIVSAVVLATLSGA